MYFTHSYLLGLIVCSAGQGDAHTAPRRVSVQDHHHHLVTASSRLLQRLVSILYQLLKLLHKNTD